MVNGMLILTIFVTSNVLLTNGFGSLSLQRNKNNLWFVLLNSVCVLVGSFLASLLYFVIYKYILDVYNIEKLGILVMVLLSGIVNFIALELIKWANKEMYYYYDHTYSFVINLGVVIGIMYCINFQQTIAKLCLEAFLIGLCYFVTNFVFASVYSRLHNKKISRNIRPVPITILAMAVLSMVIYAINISL